MATFTSKETAQLATFYDSGSTEAVRASARNHKAGDWSLEAPKQADPIIITSPAGGGTSYG